MKYQTKTSIRETRRRARLRAKRFTQDEIAELTLRECIRSIEATPDLVLQAAGPALFDHLQPQGKAVADAILEAAASIAVGRIIPDILFLVQTHEYPEQVLADLAGSIEYRLHGTSLEGTVLPYTDQLVELGRRAEARQAVDEAEQILREESRHE